jgi:hypothetical protein
MREAAIVGLINSERLGSNPMAILKNSERAGIDFLSVVFRFLFFLAR